jgi:uracil-DNA glycosylase
LGVTAATAAFGKAVRLKDYRGTFSQSSLSDMTFVTTHPSALLRIPEEEIQQLEYRRFVDELRLVQSHLHEGSE